MYVLNLVESISVAHRFTKYGKPEYLLNGLVLLEVRNVRLSADNDVS
jgi:hypothetical protein